MLTLAILFILFIGAYSGYKSGIITGLIRTIGYTISLMFALNYYKIFSELIYLIVPYPSPFSPVANPYHYYDVDLIFTLDQSYYYLVSFSAILVFGWFITRFISQLLSYFIEELFILEPLSAIAGAIIGFIVNYLTVFLLIFILSTIPYDFVQNKISESWLADSMLTSTPALSRKAYLHFVHEVHEEEIIKHPTMELEDLKEKVKPEENEENDE